MSETSVFGLNSKGRKLTQDSICSGYCPVDDEGEFVRPGASLGEIFDYFRTLISEGEDDFAYKELGEFLSNPEGFLGIETDSDDPMEMMNRHDGQPDHCRQD